MTTNKYKETGEAGLYRLYLHDMLMDIIHSGLVSYSQSTWDTLVRFGMYYNPSLTEYVARCETWQIAMCQQTVPGDWDRLSSWPTGILVSLGALERDNHYDWTLRNADPFLLKALHQIVRLVFKFEDGAARTKTDLEAVKQRLSRPTTVYEDGQSHDTLNLTKQEILGMRDILKYLVAPISWEDLSGRFGPGSSSDVKSNHDKFLNAPLKVGLPGILEMLHLPRNDTLFGGSLDRPLRSFFQYGITKIAEVPKSLKSTRVVSSEPANSMFCQLAINDELERMLNTIYSDIISLDDADQHSRHLWWKGYTSIDLSDASDHVSRRLVFQILPQWREYLFSSRSTFAKFPDGTICPLRTFAPMGAGHCFSVLTTVVLAICRYAARRRVFVYGDDIICHVTDYHAIVDLLTRSGLVVNQQKSCPLGIYREACGLEILHNLNVTPLLMRHLPKNVGIHTLEKWLARLEDNWGGPTIWVRTRERLIHEWLNAHGLPALRWRRRYQRWEIKVPVPSTSNRRWMLHGEDSLRRWLTLATSDRNERPDSAYSWVGPQKPSLATWQQSLTGRAEKAHQNLAGRIAERSRDTKLELQWKGVHEFPRFWELMSSAIINNHFNMEVLNDNPQES